MSDAEILRLAEAAGITVDWTDASGQPQRVSRASLERLLPCLGLSCATAGDVASSLDLVQSWHTPLAPPPLVTASLGMPTRLPGVAGNATAELRLEDGTIQPLSFRDGVLPPVRTIGYHRLRLAKHELTLAVAPARCVTPEDLAPLTPLYGIAVQIYGLRRGGDLGIGDATSLALLAEEAAKQGADALAISPAHSLFPDDPHRISPYSPSTRLYLNPLLADPAAALGAERVARARASLIDAGSAETLPMVDWPLASAAKYTMFRRLFETFAASDLAEGTALATTFRDFVRESGERLLEHAQHEAMRGGLDSPDYPLFLQWLADRSFAVAQERARAAGMRIGLIADLAVGLDPGGSYAQSRPQELLPDLNIGAPPDLFNPLGQDWGLSALSPRALVTSGFAPFIATLRAAMRHAGGVRIDHAMGLMRLWLVPRGRPSSEGAYLAYPLDDLLRLLALESHRHRAIVIGEDLGTVPPDFRARCREHGIGGMDILWFQREGNALLPPRTWRSDAVAMTTTHDLPTVAGWWRGTDIEVRRKVGRALDDNEPAERARDRTALWSACVEAGVAAGKEPAADAPNAAVDAALAFVGKAPSALVIAPLEDLLAVEDQPNLPGTIDEHPNWRRRFAAPVTELLEAAPVRRRLQRLAERRR